jgi:hypothetical protein
MDRTPFRVLSPPLCRPTRRSEPASPEVFAPFNDFTRASPVMERLVQRRPGSALGLSQPLSGFRTHELHGLVSCRDRSWVALLQSFPLAGIAHPSRGRMLPCGHPRASCDAPISTLRRRFHRLPRSRALAWIPATSMSSLSTRRSPLPARSRSSPTGSSWPAHFTRFEALFLLRIRSRRLELPRPDGRCSPGLSPLQRPCPNLGASDPP